MSSTVTSSTNLIPDLVSIVIVAHNNWPDVELAIQSALQQSYPSVEVIVVDNSSSDATPDEVPRRFGKLVRYLRQTNVGDSGGYNTGLQASVGEFIQFLDGDDFLARDKIEKQIEVMSANTHIDIVYGDVRRFQTIDDIPGWKDRDTREYDDILSAIISPDKNCAGLVGHSLLYRRSSLERIGAWDESLYIADVEYWLRAAWARCRFMYCPGSLCFYRMRPGQMSADASAMRRGMEAVWGKALTYITDEPYRSQVAKQLALSRFCLALYQDDMSIPKRLRLLMRARNTGRNAITMIAFAIGVALVIIPGGRLLVQKPWLRPLRRSIGNLFDLL